MSAAHGYAMITRRAQLVLVHVDVGTQNLGASVHNAARGRVPAIIVAGLSPVTAGGERVGTRNEFIHYFQDTPRQHEIVGQYMKWAYELRAPETVDAVLLRGIQIATTSPEGPVYITGARESGTHCVPPSREPEPTGRQRSWGACPKRRSWNCTRALSEAERPIVITAYLGRQPRQWSVLSQLSERFGLGVCEVSPEYLNFPGDHCASLELSTQHAGGEADLILMLDVDVPWIAPRCGRRPDAQLFHIDADPVKGRLAFWHFPSPAQLSRDTLRCWTSCSRVDRASITGTRGALRLDRGAQPRLRRRSRGTRQWRNHTRRAHGSGARAD